MTTARGVAALLATFLALLAAATNARAAQAPVKHEIRATLAPREHRIQVTDRVTVPPGLVAADGSVRFSLYSGMGIRVSDPAAPVPESHAGPVPAGSDLGARSTTYRIYLPPGRNRFTLTYEGAVFDAPAGIIDAEGALLSGASRWYPQVQGPDGDALVAFALQADVPAAWDVVSQGARRERATADGRTTITWQETQPQDEIFLVAGPFTEYVLPGGPAVAMVYLRRPDKALADRYLTATVRDIAMYDKLIGPYPYAKFALVANRWETGFGMPSFTLMGPTIIRFPFIVDTSFPHEILHNWWGNGVFVDYSGGNWSEGLTVYLADHLLKEQQGQGAAYRRDALQRYGDFVRSGRDFPLKDFVARHGEVSQAVGYDKSMMLFHMLRRRLGDDRFLAAVRGFYRDDRFTRASFADLADSFSKTSGTDLKPVFDQWVGRPGAPALAVADVKAAPRGEGFRLTATLRQTQGGEPFALQVPVAVTLEGKGLAVWWTVRMDGATAAVSLDLPARPLWLEVDPEFDVFRRLAPGETPPALSGLFGADKALFVLPSEDTDARLAAYRALADAWRNGNEAASRVVLDDELKALPDDGTAVWLLGWDNRFRREVAGALADQGVVLTDDGLILPAGPFGISGHSLVLAAREAKGSPLGWIAADAAVALPGLTRKLPHYGKYGYLGFEGPAPDNVLKGQWEVRRSPLSVPVAQADGSQPPKGPAPRAPRPPLVGP